MNCINFKQIIYNLLYFLLLYECLQVLHEKQLVSHRSRIVSKFEITENIVSSKYLYLRYIVFQRFSYLIDNNLTSLLIKMFMPLTNFTVSVTSSLANNPFLTIPLYIDG